MSLKDLKKPELKEDLKEEDSDLNDRVPGKLNDSYDDEYSRRTPSRRADTKNDEEENDAYDSHDDDYISRGDRTEKSGITEKGTGRKSRKADAKRATQNEDKSGTEEHREQDNLLDRKPGETEMKYTPFEFNPITAETDAKEFDLKSNTRFGFFDKMLKAC